MAERKSIATVYERLRKGTTLPTYAELNTEYDLDAIPHDTTRPAREAAKKLFERTDSFRKILEGLLQPEGLAEMQEASGLAPAMTEEIAAILRALMRIDRELLTAELTNSEEAYLAFITRSHPTWMALKERLRPIVTALEACWTQANGTKNDLRYLG